MLFAVSSADGHKPLRYEEPYNESAMRQAGAGLGRLSTNIEAVKKKKYPRAVSDPMCKSGLVRRAADYLCGVSATPGATREDEVESMQPGSTARSLVAPACRGVHSIHRSRKSRKLLLFQMSREIITAHSYCLLRFRDSLLWTGGTVF
jgi:hypothetical protein